MAFRGSETSQLNWWPPHCTYSGMCYYSVIYSQFLCFSPGSFPRKRERSKYSSQGEDSVERSDGDRLTLQVPTQRRESFLYKSDSEFELASKCVTSRHHSFSEG